MQITRFKSPFPTPWHLIFIQNRSLSLWLAAAFFVFTNAIALSLAVDEHLNGSHLIGPLIWFVAHGSLLIGMLRFRPQHDPYILPIVSFLSGWGILLVDRLAANFLARQITWVVVGTAVIALLQLPRNYSWLRRYRYTLLTLGLVLLGTTFFLGVNPSGAAAANYWLQLPFRIPIYFQPSELLKILIVIFLASYFDQQEFLLPHSTSSTKQGLLSLIAPITLMGGFCLLLLIWQQDLGAATLFFILFLSLFYVATGKRRLIFAGIGLLIVAGFFAYFQFDVVALRIDAWLNPWPDADGRAFQIVQSLYAIASGGVFGQGIGQGFPDYIPVVHSDFVFAAVAEEWGLLGSLTVVGCYGVLTHRGYLAALHLKRPFYRYLCVGITTLLATQALLIMGGVTKLLPLTGVTLPFLSYGGSSMMISHLMIGLLLFATTQSYSQSTPAIPITAVRQHIVRLHQVVLGGFLLVSLSLLFWPLVRANAILTRDDNPRQVEQALRVRRGRILDANGRVLAESVGEDNVLLRRYPLGTHSGPALGYYSFRHGTAGVEASFNEWLNGNTSSPNRSRFFEQNILHQPAQGADIQLTLDAELQEFASTLLTGHTGGILIFRLSNDSSHIADILAMVSHPAYDPNQLNAQFDALIADDASPLLNRTTFGQYQPGFVLQPFLVASAIHHGELMLIEPYEPQSNLGTGVGTAACVEQPPENATWTDSLKYQCEGPLRQLGNRLGQAGLTQSFAEFGLTMPISLTLALEEMTFSQIEEPDWAALGQDTLVVSPLILARAWMGLMSNGRLPQLRLVSHTRLPNGIGQPVLLAKVDPMTAVSPNVARAVQEILPQTEDGITEFSATAVSDQENNRDSWYLGAKEIDGDSYFVVIILEENNTAVSGTEIGRLLFQRVEQE